MRSFIIALVFFAMAPAAMANCDPNGATQKQFCSTQLAAGAAAKAAVEKTLGQSLNAVKYYESLRGENLKTFDNVIRAALKDKDPSLYLSKWITAGDGIQYATATAILAAPSLAIFVIMLIVLIPFCCARCCWACRGEEAGSTMGGCCGPDNCCYPRHAADEYSFCSPCGGKALAVGFWLLFALIALAMSGISITQSAGLVNSMSKSICVFGDMGPDLGTFAGKFRKSFADIESASNDAIAEAKNLTATAPPGAVTELQTALDTTSTATKKFICETTWNTGTCVAAWPATANANIKMKPFPADVSICPDQKVKCVANGKAVGDSVCCIWKDEKVAEGTAFESTFTFTPTVAIEAAGDTVGLGKAKKKAVDDIAAAKVTIKKAADGIQDQMASAEEQVKAVKKTAADLDTKLVDLQGTVTNGACSAKETFTMVNQYTYLGASVDHALDLLAIVFGLIGIVAMYICKPQTEGSTYPQNAKLGVCCMRCSWILTVTFMLFYGLLGIIPVILSVVVGDTCYTIKTMPTDFNAYLGGSLIPSVEIQPANPSANPPTEAVMLVPAKVVQVCYDGKPLLDAVPFNVASVSDLVDWKEMEKMQVKGLDVPFTAAEKKQVTDQGFAMLTANMNAVEASLADVQVKADKIPDEVIPSLKTSLGAIDTASATLKTIDCVFIKKLYDGLADALCQDGLESSLWITLSFIMIAWCGLPMMICAVLINVRLGGVGQRGAWTRGIIADGAGDGNDLKKDGDNFASVQMTSGNYNLP